MPPHSPPCEEAMGRDSNPGQLGTLTSRPPHLPYGIREYLDPAKVTVAVTNPTNYQSQVYEQNTHDF